MSRDTIDVYASTLFDAEIPDIAHPLVRRRPPPNVPLAREVRDAVEDTLEKFGVAGVSWAWDVTDVISVGRRAVIVLADCRKGGDAVVGVVLNDDLQRDVRNVRHYLLLIRSRRIQSTGRAQAKAAA